MGCAAVSSTGCDTILQIHQRCGTTGGSCVTFVAMSCELQLFPKKMSKKKYLNLPQPPKFWQKSHPGIRLLILAPNCCQKSPNQPEMTRSPGGWINSRGCASCRGRRTPALPEGPSHSCCSRRLLRFQVTPEVVSGHYFTANCPSHLPGSCD